MFLNAIVFLNLSRYKYFRHVVLGSRQCRHQRRRLFVWSAHLQREAEDQSFRVAEDSQDFLQAKQFHNQEPTWRGT